MAYKEPHFDSEGAKALYKALTQANDNITKGKKKSTAKKSTAKKTATKKKGK